MQLTGEKLEEHLREKIKDFPDQSPSWQAGYCRAMSIAKEFIDSIPSPTLERKMEWRGDGDEICSINGIDLGRINYDPYGNISAIYTLSGERSKDADFGNAKLRVEQTVSSELNSLGSDGRILQAVKEGKLTLSTPSRMLNFNDEDFAVTSCASSLMGNVYSGTDPNAALNHLLGETK